MGVRWDSSDMAHTVRPSTISRSRCASPVVCGNRSSAPVSSSARKASAFSATSVRLHVRISCRAPISPINISRSVFTLPASSFRFRVPCLRRTTPHPKPRPRAPVDVGQDTRQRHVDIAFRHDPRFVVHVALAMHDRQAEQYVRLQAVVEAEAAGEHIAVHREIIFRPTVEAAGRAPSPQRPPRRSALGGFLAKRHGELTLRQQIRRRLPPELHRVVRRRGMGAVETVLAQAAPVASQPRRGFATERGIVGHAPPRGQPPPSPLPEGGGIE